MFFDRLVIYWQAIILPLAAMIGGCASSSRPQIIVLNPPAPVSGLVQFEDFGSGIILLEASTGEPASYVIFDTAAPFSALDVNAFPDLTTYAAPSLGSRRFTVSPPHVKAGPFDLASGGICECVDLSGVSQACGKHVIGILGVPAVSGGVLQIDFQRHTIRTEASDGAEHPEWGKARLLTRDSLGYWESPFDLDGTMTNLIIDAGSNSFIVASPSVLRAVLQKHEFRKFDRVLTTAYGSTHRALYNVPHFRIDDHTWAVAQFHETQESLSSVGAKYLKFYLVTTDFSRGILYLRLNLPQTQESSRPVPTTKRAIQKLN